MEDTHIGRSSSVISMPGEDANTRTAKIVTMLMVKEMLTVLTVAKTATSKKTVLTFVCSTSRS